jgi:sugar/nucleoside kinase (ribokinase family)
MLDYLKSRGCKVGGVTQGEHGCLWFDETGAVSRLPALPVPSEKIIDTSGAGDVFHGAYLAAYLARPEGRWIDHLTFARAASAWKIQHLGNEAGLPSQAQVAEMIRLYSPK